MRYDVVIIGAGLSGLAAGIRCAYFEKKVAVFERHTTIGGLNSFYRLESRNYDVGLHAVTNYAAPGTRKGPMAKLLKQLRLRWDDFALRPQLGSRIAFPNAGAELKFNNDVELFLSEVERAFPDQIHGFRKLRDAVNSFNSLDLNQKPLSSREVVGEYIDDPLLTDMIFNPLQFYGSAIPNDMDWSQFCIMWQALFEEGFGRPIAGVRPIMKVLTKQYKEFGGELFLRNGVRRIVTDNGKAVGVVLDDGSEVECDLILSSAGSLETDRMIDADAPPAPPREKLVKGAKTPAAFDHTQIAPPPDRRLSFMEAIYVLDRSPREINHNDTIIFYSTANYGASTLVDQSANRFRYDIPSDAVDPTSGVICSPNNFAYDNDLDGATDLAEGFVRVTCLANPDYWMNAGSSNAGPTNAGSSNGESAPADSYEQAKSIWTTALADTAATLIPDFRPHIIDTDTFTPRTVAKYTGKAGGNIYGAPTKNLTGQTEIEGLHICGTDQGFLGIVGAMLSGISIANGAAL